MAIITDTAPAARRARVAGINISHYAAYTVFAAAAGFTVAVVLGLF